MIGDGTVETLAGTGDAGFLDGPSAQANFNEPSGIVSTPAGELYLTEFGSQHVRRIAIDGSVLSLAGSVAGYADGLGSAARFNNPRGLALDADGNLIVADQGNFRIRRVTRDGRVTTLAGTGEAGLLDGLDAEAQFNEPTGVAVDQDGNLWVTDRATAAVRQIVSATVAVEVASNLAGRTTQNLSSRITGVNGACYFRMVATNVAGTTLGAIVRCDTEDGSSPTGLEDYAAFQVWRANAFGDAAGDAQVSGLQANPDGDPFSNLLEYAFDLNPTVVSENPVTVIYEGGTARIIYPRRVDATGLLYVPEWSTNLTDWTAQGITQELVPGPVIGATETVVAVVPEAIVAAAWASNLSLFVRVTVNAP